MPSVRLSPELEYFLSKLKEKYRIEEADFAKLLFLLDDWSEEVHDRALEKAMEVVGVRM
jgi:hypothetical protein